MYLFNSWVKSGKLCQESISKDHLSDPALPEFKPQTSDQSAINTIQHRRKLLETQDITILLDMLCSSIYARHNVKGKEDDDRILEDAKKKEEEKQKEAATQDGLKKNWEGKHKDTGRWKTSIGDMHPRKEDLN